MSYEEWASVVPAALREDPLWRREDYRLSLYIADLGWDDVRRLVRERATDALSDQLGRALGSISANIAEGYSRASGTDRARFYEYALGSAREARDWYHKARHVLGPKIARHRLRVLTSIIRLLTYSIPHERAMRIHPTPKAPPRFAQERPASELHTALIHATSNTHPATLPPP